MERPEEKKTEDFESWFDEPENPGVEALPAPEGVPREVIEAVKYPEIDLNFYSYEHLAKLVHAMPPIPKITMGFCDIDQLLDGGGHRGEVMVVSAMTKSGKTNFCQNMTYLQAKNGVTCLWFSLEMSWIEITNKFMGMDSSYTVSKVPQDLPIYYSMNNPGMNMDKLWERTLEAKKAYGVDIVYVDHLHFLLSMEDAGKSNTSFLIGSIMRRLKRMAVELDVMVVLIAHTKKVELGVAPDLNSLRDSSFIAQEADFVLMLWRQRKEMKKKTESVSDDMEEEMDSEDLYTGRTFISMEANRRGPNKRFVYGFSDGMFYPWNDYLKKKSTQEFFEQRKAEFAQKNPYVVTSPTFIKKEKDAARKKKEQEEFDKKEAARLAAEEIERAQTKLLDDVFPTN